MKTPPHPLTSTARAHRECARNRSCTRKHCGLQCIHLRLPLPLPSSLKSGRGLALLGRLSQVELDQLRREKWLNSLGPYGCQPRYLEPRYIRDP